MWADYVMNPKMLQGVFKNKIPSLERIVMYNVAVEFGGDLVCKLSFDLDEFPTDIPAKWILLKYNKIKVSLSLINSEIKYFAVSGGQIKGNLVITSSNSSLAVELISINSIHIFTIIAKWIHVDDVSGYIL